MGAFPEIQFQISLLNIAALGEAEQAKELEKLLEEPVAAEKN